jgi:hypothetical protein
MRKRHGSDDSYAILTIVRILDLYTSTAVLMDEPVTVQRAQIMHKRPHGTATS